MCNIDKFTYNDAIITVIRSIGVVENLLQKKKKKGGRLSFILFFFPLAVLLGIALLLLLPPSCDHNKQPTKRCHGIVSRSYFYYLPKLEAPWDLNYTNTKKNNNNRVTT